MCFFALLSNFFLFLKFFSRSFLQLIIIQQENAQLNGFFASKVLSIVHTVCIYIFKVLLLYIQYVYLYLKYFLLYICTVYISTVYIKYFLSYIRMYNILPIVHYLNILWYTLYQATILKHRRPFSPVSPFCGATKEPVFKPVSASKRIYVFLWPRVRFC